MEGHCIIWQITDPFCKDNNHQNKENLTKDVVNLYVVSS